MAKKTTVKIKKTTHDSYSTAQGAARTLLDDYDGICAMSIFEVNDGKYELRAIGKISKSSPQVEPLEENIPSLSEYNDFDAKHFDGVVVGANKWLHRLVTTILKQCRTSEPVRLRIHP